MKNEELKIKDREVRKSIILSAAKKVFAAKPFDKVSMQEIAQEAGFAKSSIYNYYPNQETLFLEVALYDGVKLKNELSSIICESDYMDCGFILNAVIDYFMEHDSLLRIVSLVLQHGNLNPESIERMTLFNRNTLELFDIVFKKMGYKGDVRLLSHTLNSMLNGILITYKKSPGKSESEKGRHMKRIAEQFKKMCICLIENQ